eukprot:5755209-Amphidinium_carterae.1
MEPQGTTGYHSDSVQRNDQLQDTYCPISLPSQAASTCVSPLPKREKANEHGAPSFVGYTRSAVHRQESVQTV